ncbi:hypothetical protein HDU83_005867 [Entophlyctis luteolus]|nr:hypothetical protein HDU83_005867 [Entophlyctis luteolus]
MNQDIWHPLVDEAGVPAFEGTSADKVQLSTDADVADFRKKVWEENKERVLSPVRLNIFTNKDDIANPAKVLEADAPVNGLGEAEKTPLFVVVPKKTRPSGSIQSIASKSMDVDVRWKDEEPTVYSLRDSKLYFVNRSDAVEQLQKIHRSKFIRATTGGGIEWIIPIADNVSGLGKSEFGRHYIRKFRESRPDETRRDAFERTLCDCHTVPIVFHRGALLEDSFEAVMMRFLCDALEDLFVVQPAIISNPPKTVNAFLKYLTKVAGPVFIVLDEIGKAFEREIDPLDDFQQRDQFLSFCENILDKWLSLKNVFFVVLGRASFLNYVGLRPLKVQNVKPTQYIFQRLNIQLLRPSSIRSIMDNTLISSAGTATIASRLGLTPENSQAVADHLFRQTNGHPRSLLAIFGDFSSVDEIFEYFQPRQLPDWKPLYDKLVLNKVPVMNLLQHVESGLPVDLAETIADPGGKTVTLDNIATNSFFGWEGTLMKARLYVHPIVKEYVENYVLPFREYLKHIGNVAGESIDYPNVFEWMFLRRFQEIFSKEPKDPRLVLPAFFGTAKFGNYKSVSFSGFVRPIPKITNASSASASLDSNTVHPPLSKSASCDGFLMGTAICGVESVLLTVGLAIKNYRTTEFSWSHLSRECSVFNRMFEGTDCTGRRNILFICCTHYSSEVMSKFNREWFFVHNSNSYPNIDEIILLNLCDKNLRQRFFDVGNGLSAVVESVVKKAEVEYQVVM